MAAKLINKKSSTVIEGSPKLPLPSQLEYGQIGINYAENYETIVIRNSNDEITTFSNDAKTEEKISQAVGSLSGSVVSELNAIEGLPQVTSSDENKILKVVNGQWALVTPINVYMTYDTPNNSYGNDGDLCMLID